MKNLHIAVFLLFLSSFYCLQGNTLAAMGDCNAVSEELSVHSCFVVNEEESNLHEITVTISGGVPPYQVYVNTQDFFEVTASGETFGFSAASGEEFSLFVKDSDTVPNELFILKLDIFPCNNSSLCEDLSLDAFLDCQDDGTSILHIEVEGANGDFWFNGNQEGDTLQIGDSYWIEVVDEEGCKASINGEHSPNLKAANDWAGTTTLDLLTIDVLINDEGNCPILSKILVAPTCGEIMAVDSIKGIVYYQVAEGTDCSEDSFVYEIMDVHGNTAHAKVVIFLPETDLIAVLDRDCSAASEYGNFVLTVEVIEGQAPFIISGSINATLNDFGSVSRELEVNVPYSIEIIDAVGNVFYAFEDFACYNECNFIYIYEGSDLGECTCEGNLILNFNDLFDAGEKAISIEGIWNYQNQYGYLHVGDTIPANAHIMIFQVFTNFNCYNFNDYNEYLSGFAANLCYNSAYGFEANDDEISAIKGYPVLIDVLANDEGKGLKVKEFSGKLDCGSFIDFDEETGTVKYLSDPDSGDDCNYDFLWCVVEDICGDTEYSRLRINIETPKDFLVEIEKDCSGANEGFYILSTSILSGHPPFTITGSTYEVLNDSGTFSNSLAVNTPYEIRVEDALGRVFYEEGEENLCDFDCQSFYIQEVAEVAQCLCNREMTFNFPYWTPEEEEILGMEGTWYNENQSGEMALGDTIPNDVHYEIHRFFTVNGCYNLKKIDGSNISGWVSDFCPFIPHPEAANDVVTKTLWDSSPIFIPVLQNDTGTNLHITQIVEQPTCGEVTLFNPEGVIRYQPHSNSSCVSDIFEYEAMDNCGQTTTATVHILSSSNNSQLSVEVEEECYQVLELGIYTLNVNITNGIPPFVLSGSINTTIDSKGLVNTNILAGVPYTLHITDAIGNTFETSNDNPCFYEEICNTLQILSTYECFIAQNQDTIAFLDYKAIGGHGGYIFNGHTQEDFLQNGDLYQIEVTDMNGCMTSVSDTIDCQFTSISSIDSPISNLQLFPNPNNGNFALSLQLQQAEEVEIEVFNALGQVKLWQRLHALPTVERHDFNLDVNSGLYFIRVSEKDWVWTEKMVVE